MHEITVKLATSDDSQDIFDWRNDEQTRNMSHTTDKVEWDGHEKWLKSTLSNPERCLLICNLTREEKKVSVVRFDIDDDEAVISINMAPSMRGRGLAKLCLHNSITFFSSKNENISLIRAEIKRVNTASRKVFESVGFYLIQEIGNVAHYAFSLKHSDDRIMFSVASKFPA